jgi:hypothetical protein
VAATVVVPRVWPGHGSVTAADQSWNAPPPSSYAIVTYRPHSAQTVLDIIGSDTGRITAQLQSPGHGRSFYQVAALGSDRRFIAAAEVADQPHLAHPCATWLYQFRLTADGQIAGLRPFSMPRVQGYVSALTASANGQVVAYYAARCSGDQRIYVGQVGVTRLASRQTTLWSVRMTADPSSFSLSANGSLLGFVSNPSSGSHVGSPSYNSAWVLRTDSPAGPLSRYYRRVTGSAQTHPLPTQWPGATVVSRSGATMLTSINDPGGNTRVLALREYRVRTGHAIRTVRLLRAHGGIYYTFAGLAPSLSGRYILITVWNARIYRLDLASGRLTTLPTPATRLPNSAAW